MNTQKDAQSVPQDQDGGEGQFVTTPAAIVDSAGIGASLDSVGDAWL